MPELFQDTLSSSLIPTKVASEISGYNADYLARLCREKKIEGTQLGRSWLINRSSLEAFVAEQEDRKKQRADELRAQRGREYRRAQKPVLKAALSKTADMRDAVTRSVADGVTASRVRAEGFARAAQRAARSRANVSPHAYSPRLAALAISLVVVLGTAYASTDARTLSVLRAVPNHLVRIAFHLSPGTVRSSSFRITEADAPVNLAASVPAVPTAHDASRTVALLMPNANVAALGSVRELTDNARTPFSQTDIASLATARIASLSGVSHHPLASLVRAYVLSGESLYDAGATIANAYTAGITAAGDRALARAATLRDGIAFIPHITNTILGGYVRGVYAFNDTATKAPGTAMLALYTLGDSLSSRTASVPALALGAQDTIIANAGETAHVGALALAHTPTSEQAPLAAASAAVAPQGVQTTAVQPSSSIATTLARPFAGLYAKAVDLEGAILSLPVQAEDTMLGFAGYASSLLDGNEAPAPLASRTNAAPRTAVAPVSNSSLSASALSFLPALWQFVFPHFFHSAGALAGSFFTSAVHSLGNLIPGGTMITPTLTVLHTGPTETLALPIPANVTHGGGSSSGIAYVDTGTHTVVQNFVSNYFPGALVGSAFNDAVLAAVRPFVNDSINASLKNNRGSGGSSVTTTTGSDGATLTNVTISSGTATVSALTSSNSSLGSASATSLAVSGTSSLATTTVTGDLTVTGTFNVGTLAVSNLSSNNAVIAPYFTATSTSATSTFPNLSATNADVTALHTGQLTLGTSAFTSFLGTGLANVGGALTVSTSSFSGAGSNFNADLLDGYDSAYLLANSFSTSSADAWLTGETTDALAEGTTNLYFTNARARAALSVTGAGLTYSSTTGALAVASGYAIPLTASTTEWSAAYLNRITAANAPLSITNNTLSISQASASTDGYLSSTDWNAFNTKQAALSFTYPLLNTANTISLAFSTSTPTLGTGLAYSGTLGSLIGGTSGTLSISTSTISGSGSNFNADLLDGLDSAYFLANSFSSTSAAYYLAQNAISGFSTTSADYWLTGKSTTDLAEGSNQYFTNARADARINATSTIGTLTSAPNLGTVKTSLSGILKAASGVLSSAIAGTDYQVPLTFTYPLINSANTVSLAFGTSTSNTWGGTQTFTNAPVLGSLTGFLKATGGVLSTSLIDLSTDVSSTLPVSHGGTGSTSLTGILKGNGTGSLQTAVDGADYLSPSTFGSSFYTYFHATTTDALAQGSTNKYYSDTLARAAISSNAVGLTYTAGSGILSLTAGYTIPLTASTTEWSTFYATPSTRITAGTNLSWAGNTLNGPSDSYIHNLFSAASPLSYNAGTGAFTFSTSSISGTGSNLNADFLDGLDSTYFLANAFSTTSAAYWKTQNNFYSTTSADFWLTGKSTTNLAEGTNLYYTNNRVAGVIAGTTTDALAEGSTNKYFTNARADARINATSTIGTLTSAPNLGTVKTTLTGILKATSGVLSNAIAGTDYESPLTFTYPLQRTTNTISLAFGTTTANAWSALQTFSAGINVGASTFTSLLGTGLSNVGGVLTVATSTFSGSGSNFNADLLDGLDSTYFLANAFSTTSAAYWKTQNNFYSTTSADFWLTGKSTTNLAEGTNLYYTASRVAGVIAGTTTDALAEGSVNKYYSDTLATANFVSNLAATTSVNSITTLSNLSLPLAQTTGTLAQGRGGTGITSYTAGDILYADNSGNLAVLPVGATGQVLKVQAGLPSWGVDQTIGGGGSDGIFATSSGKIYPLDTANVLLVGTNATSTTNSIFEVNGIQYISSKLGIATTSPSAALSVAGNGLFSGTLTSGNIIDSGLTANSLLYADASKQLSSATLGTGLSFTGGALSVSTSTFSGSGSKFNADLLDGLDSTYFLANAFGTTSANYWLTTKSTSDLAEGTNLYYTDARVNTYVAASTTIPKTYTSNVFSGNNTFNGSLSIGTLNGPLQANGGVVSATSSIGVLYGGTGLTSAPTYGQLLTGNGTGGYALTATSSLGLAAAFTATYPIQYSGNVLSLAFGTTTANAWSSLQTFNAGINLGASTFTSLLGTGLSNVGGALTVATSSFSGPSSNFNADFLDGLDSTYFLANAFSTTSAAYWKTQNNFYSTTSADFWLTGKTTDNLAEGSTNLYWTNTRFDTRLSATTTLPNLTTLANLGTVKTSLTGILKATSGVLSNAIAGTDYESPLTFTYPLQRTTNTISLAFGTTTANAWSSLQTFNGGVKVGSLSGVLYGNSGTVAAAATSTPTLGTGLSYSGTLGSFVGGTSGTLSISTSTISGSGSNFNADLLDGLDSTYFLANAFSTTSANYWKTQNNFYSTTSADYWLTGKSTTNLAEGTNLYYTASRVAGVIAGTTTDALAQGSVNKYYSDTLARAALSSTATGLTYTSGTGVFSLTAGYTIPLTASTTDWNTAYLNRIASVSSPLSFTGNVLSISQAGTGSDGYLSSTDWNSFNSRLSTTTLGLFDKGYFFSTTSASYFLSQNQGAGYSTTSANYWLTTKSTTDLAEGTNLYFTNARADARINATSTIGTLTSAPNLGTVKTSLTGILKATSGVLSNAVAGTDYENPLTFTYPLQRTTNTISLAFGTTTANSWSSLQTFSAGINVGASTFTSLLGTGLTNVSGALTVATSTFSGSGSLFNADLLDGYDSTAFLANGFSTTSADYWKTQRNFYSTTSADYWLTGKTTDNLTEGTTNLYWTNTRFDTRLSATTTLPNLTTLANLGTVKTSLTGILKATSGVLSNAVAGTDYESPLTFTYPLTRTTNTISLAFGTTTANTWSSLQTFTNGINALGNSTLANATSTNLFSTRLTANTVAFGQTGSTTVSSTGALTTPSLTVGSLSGLLKATSGVVSAAVSGTDYAPATVGTNILAGNGTGGFSAVSVTSPLTFVGTTLGIQQADNTQPGYLSSTDWSTFNGKQDALTGTTGQFPYFSGTNTVTATSSLFLAASGKIGIGTTNPVSLLSLSGDAPYISVGWATSTEAGGITFNQGGSYQGAIYSTGSAYSSLTSDSLIFDSLQDFEFHPNGNVFSSAAFVIKASGNVGVGTTSPFTKFSVGGNTYLSGNLTATGAVAFTGLGSGLVKSTSGTLSTATAGTDYAPATVGTNILAGNGTGGFNAVSVSSPLTFVGTTLGIQKADNTQPGYLSSTDWTTFNGKQDALTFTYPLVNSANTISLAFGTTTANSWSALQTFNGGVKVGSLSGVLYGNSGTVASAATSTATLGTGLSYSGTLGSFIGGTSGTLSISTSSFSGTGSNFNADLLDGQTGTYYLSRANHTGTQLASTISDFSSTARGLLSSTATGLTYTSGTGVFSLTAGYNIPLTASTTDWNTAYANRITSATYPLQISSNVLSLAFGTTTANSWSALQTFNGGITTAGTVTLGSLTGVLHASSGVVSASNVNLASEVTGTLSVANGGTGSTTLTGILKGNGTGGVQTAVAGTDYQAPGNYITALTGDVTASGPGSAAATLATVNSNVGSFGGSTAIPTFTVNAKGLITAAGSVAVIAPAGTLTGTTLASNVVTSSLTSVGTLSALTVSGNTTLANATSTNLFSGRLTANTAAFGQTGSTTIASTGALTTPSLTIGSLSGLLYANSGAVAAATVSSPLTYSAGTLGIQVANGSQNGYLSSANWTTFNAKENALTFTYPLTRSTNTINLDFGTTTANTWSALQTFSGGIAATYLGISSALFDSSFSAGTNGQILQTTGSAVQWVSTSTLGLGTGTVTSVNASGGTTGLSFSGGPITNSGTLTLAGTLGVANGGTGSTTLSGILLGNGTGAVNTLGLGTGLSFNTGTLSIATSSLFTGTTGQFPYFSGTNTLTATSSLFLATNGYLGFGTTNPQALLDVVGTTTSANSLLRVEQHSTATGAYGLEIHTYADNGASPTAGTGAQTGLVIHNYSDAGPAMIIDQTRSTPLLLLRNSANPVTSAGTKGTGSFIDFAGYGLTSSSTLSDLGQISNHLTFYSYDPLVKWTFATGLLVKTGLSSYLTTSGGIATSGTDETYNALRLSADDTAVALDAGVSNTGAYSWLQSHARTDYSTNYNLSLNPNGGNVGIGTTSPISQLTLDSSSAVGQLYINNTGASNNISINLARNNTVKALVGVAGATNGIVTGSILDDLAFRTAGGNILFSTDSGSTAQLYLKNGGNIGIGTTTPTAKLALAGGNFLQSVTTAPVVAGSVSIASASNGIGTYVQGHYAYSVDAGSGFKLSIIDVTTPTAPVVVGSVTDVTNLAGAFSVKVAGNYAYVTATSGGRLTVVDVTNPSAPAVVGVLTNSALGGARGLYISGRYAYVAGNTSGALAIVDISNPTSPVLVGSVTSSGNLDSADSVYVAGKYAYVTSTTNNKLTIVDISNPTAPAVVGSYGSVTNISNPKEVWVAGRYAYVLGQGSNSLAVIDVSNPASPSLAGVLFDNTNLNAPKDMFIAGRYAYVTANSGNRLTVVDISNPAVPFVASSLNDGTNLNNARGVFISGKYAYISAGSKFTVVDITGIDVPSANLGVANTEALSVYENGDIGNDLSVRNGLTVGAGGIYSGGSLSVLGTAGVNPFTVASSTGTSLLTLTGAGNLGIGTSTPWANLAIDASAGAYPFAIGSSTNPVFTVLPSGGVSVGTIGETIASSGFLNTRGDLFASGSLASEGVIYTDSGLNLNGASILDSGANLINLGGTIRAASGNGLSFQTNGASTARLVIDTSGNVGIGTSTPYAQLALGGGNLVLGAATAGGTPGDLFLPKLGTAAGSFLAVDASGKVIATTTPSSSLTGTTGQVAYFSGTNTAIGTSTLFISTAGRVGIGQTSPTALLHITGTQPAASTAGTAATDVLKITGGNGGDNNATSGFAFGGTGANVSIAAGAGGAITGTPSNGFGGTGGNITLTAGAGGVGGGTSATAGAAGIITINGGAAPTATGGVGGPVNISGGSGGFSGTAGGSVFIGGGTGVSTATAGNVILGFNSNVATNPRGLVGVGTSTPWGLLSVDAETTNLVSGAPEFVIGSSSATHLLVNSSGYLGLGTTSPYAQLSLGGGNLVLGAATAGGTPGDLFLPKLGTAAGSFLAVDATGKVIATTTPAGGGLTGTTGQVAYFSGTNTAVGTSTITISPSGNVGIGTTSPTYNLSVVSSAAATPLFVRNEDFSVPQAVFQGKYSIYGYNSGLIQIGGSSSASLRLQYDDNAGDSSVNSTGFLHLISGGSTAFYANGSRVGLAGAVPNLARLEVSAAGGSDDLLMLSSTNSLHGDRFIVKNSGSVGIGTSTPWSGYKLAVNGTTLIHTTTNYNLSLDSSGISAVDDSGALATFIATGGTATLQATADANVKSLVSGAVRLSTAAGEKLTVTSGGNVGIGSTTPTSAFSVGVDSYFGGNVGIGSSSPTAALSFAAGGTTAAKGINFGDSTANLYRASAGVIKTDGNLYVAGGQITGGLPTLITTSGGTAFASVDNLGLNAIAGSGSAISETVATGLRAVLNVGGVLTWAPNNASNSSIFNGLLVAPTLNAGASNSGGTFYGARINPVITSTTGLSSVYLFAVAAGSNDKFVINSGGNVGVGTTTPAWAMTISSSTRPQLALTDGSLTSNIWTFRNAGSNLYVATSSPSTYATSTTAAWTFGSLGGLVGFNATGGDKGIGTINAQTVYANNVALTSDARYKADIQPLDSSEGLSFIQSLAPVSYHWANPGMGTDINFGFLAQDVQKIAPQLVSVGNDKDHTLALNYIGLISPAIKAIQELAVQTSDLSLATTSLASRFASLSASLNASLADIQLPHALTATVVTADSMTIAQGVSAGTLTTQSVTASGTVSAARYVVPLTANVFSFGSTTISMHVPSEALASGGNVDLYKLAGYAVAGTDALAARTDLLATKLDDLTTRIAALEALHSATTTASTTDGTSTAEGALGLTITTIQDALKGLGIIIHKGYLALDSLVTHQLFLVKGEDGTSSTGSQVIPAGATTLNVTNPLVHPSSKIFLTFTSSVDGSWYLSKKQEGSFTITLAKPQPADTEFDYFLLQTDPNAQVAAVDQANQPPAGASEAPTAPASVSQDGGPVVSLNGEAAIQLAQGATWTDPGAHATAADGTDLTSSITVAGSVDTNTAGLYTLTYNVVDAAGKGGQASRVVSVLAPTTAPSSGTTVTDSSGAGGSAGGSTGGGTTGSTGGSTGAGTGTAPASGSTGTDTSTGTTVTQAPSDTTATTPSSSDTGTTASAPAATTVSAGTDTTPAS